MRKPNFFIVGAAKAGTTSIHYYLSKHPDIYMSPIKEPNYFCNDIDVKNFNAYMKNKFSNSGVQLNTNNKIVQRHTAYISDKEEYLSLFSASKNEKILGEASVSYLFSEKAASELYKFSPDAKIIIVLRNPIDRAFSHYLMDLRMGVTSDNFIDAVKYDYNQVNKGWCKTHLYIELGLYYCQVKRYCDLFDNKNILFLKHEELATNTIGTVNQICRFLNVKENIILINDEKRNTASLPKNSFISFFNKQSLSKQLIRKVIPQSIKNLLKENLFSSKNIPKISIKDREALGTFFNKDIKALQDLTELDLSEWIVKTQM